MYILDNFRFLASNEKKYKQHTESIITFFRFPTQSHTFCDFQILANTPATSAYHSRKHQISFCYLCVALFFSCTVVVHITMPSDDEAQGEGGSGAESELEEVSQEEKDLLLINACKAGDLKETKRCIKDGSSPTAVAPDGWTPLIWAACNGHEGCVQYLLDQGAGQEYVRREDGKKGAKKLDNPKGMDKADTVNSPLHWASFKGYIRIVWILLKAKFSPYDIDACGNTSLHLAATGGSVEVLRCLMSRGFDLSIRNWYGNTSLDLADKPETRELLQKAMRQKVCFASGKGFSAAVLRYYCTHSGQFFCEEETVSDEVTIAVGKPDTKPVRYCRSRTSIRSKKAKPSWKAT